MVRVLDINSRLQRLQQLRSEHGIRGVTLVPDLALVGLIDDVIDAAETALELLATAHPYRAYSMVRTAFEASQRLLIIGTSSDYAGIGTRAWLYYRAKDNALGEVGDGARDQEIEDQFVETWEQRFPLAREVVEREKATLDVLRKKRSPDNFLGKSLAPAAQRAYEQLMGENDEQLPDSIPVNRAIYGGLSRESHACLRLDPMSIRIDTDGYVELGESPRDADAVARNVELGLDDILREAIAATEHRLRKRRAAHVADLKQQLQESSVAEQDGYAPDLGCHLVETGLGGNGIEFPNVPLLVIGSLADGTVCSTSTAGDGSSEYVATFEFRGEARAALMARITDEDPELAAELDALKPEETVELAQPVLVDIRAELGVLQTNEAEVFIPLNVLRLKP